MPRVNPEILRWAREGAGLDLREAARKIGLNAARGVEGPDRLASLERGEWEPSRPMLVKMAHHYHQPLLVFYLPAPPPTGRRGQDFRTLPLDEVDESGEAVLNVILRDVTARQELIRAALEDEDEPEPLPFVGSASLAMGVPALVDQFRQSLRLSVADYRGAGSADDAFRLLRERVESTGVYVIFVSDLGSHHTRVNADRFRGFALADPIAPFIVINDQDSRAAWAFTLLHELAHIWIGFSGVSGGPPVHEVERFCNDVASYFLLPDAGDLARLGANRQSSIDELQGVISDFADRARVSRKMIAYRLFRQGVITEAQWLTVSAAFRQQWLEQRETDREATRGKPGGPDWYVVRRHRMGDALLQTTARLLAAGALTSTKAGRILGVKPGNIPELFAGRPGGARRAG
jgi:Zn-dependent peptidase ImmA (M78 family)/transcriptional regulator with XRE-family HTH domain